MVSNETVWVESTGGRLAVYVAGKGESAVYLLHGGPGVPDYLAPVADLLRSTHTVVRYDQRGTGNSAEGFTAFDLDSQVRDLEAIRASLGHVRICLFGHSWGGTLAQLYAIRYPDRVDRIFLSNSGIGLGQDWRVMEQAVMAHNRARGGLSGFLKLGFSQLCAMLPGVADAGAQKVMALVWNNYFDPPSSAPAPDQAWLAGVRSAPLFKTRSAAVSSTADRLDPSGLPAELAVLVLFGEDDIYGETTQILFDRFPDGQHVVLKGCGHIPWLQAPEAFQSDLFAFFSL